MCCDEKTHQYGHHAINETTERMKNLNSLLLSLLILMIPLLTAAWTQLRFRSAVVGRTFILSSNKNSQRKNE